MAKSARRVRILLTLVVSLVLVPAAAGQAASPPSVPYLALGDSVPYGWDVVTQPATVAPSLHAGYPEMLADRSPLEVTNASCPGETSGHFIDLSEPDNGCEFVKAYLGLKADWGSGSQLDFAEAFLADNPDTGLVTIMLGANDLFLCQAGSGGCSLAEFQAVLAQTATNLAHILTALRATGYDGTIALVGYYSLDYRDPTQTFFSQASLATLEALASDAAFGDVVVADGFAAFEQASRRTGGDVCAAGLLLVEDDGSCDVHTSPRGDRVLAQAVHRAVDMGAIVRHRLP